MGFSTGAVMQERMPQNRTASIPARMAPLAMMMARGEWRKDEGGGGMERGFRVSGRGGLPENQGSGSSWEPSFLMGGRNMARKAKAMTVRSSSWPTPGMKSGIRSMGEKAIGRRQQEEHQLTFGEKPRFSLPAAEIVDGPDQQLLVGALGGVGRLFSCDCVRKCLPERKDCRPPGITGRNADGARKEVRQWRILLSRRPESSFGRARRAGTAWSHPWREACFS